MWTLLPGLQSLSKGVTACSFQDHGKRCSICHAVLELWYVQVSLPPAQRTCLWSLQVSSATGVGSSQTLRAGVGCWQEQWKADKERAEVTHAWLITAGTQTPSESDPRFVWQLLSLHGATSDWRLSCGEKWTAVAAEELDIWGKRAVTPEHSLEASRWGCPCSTCHQNTLAWIESLNIQGSQNLNVTLVSKCLLETKKTITRAKVLCKIRFKKENK